MSRYRRCSAAGLIVAGCVIAARQRPIDTGGIEVGL